MKRIFAVTALLLVILTGCGANHTGKLDTSKLEKVDYGKISKDVEKKLPILYSAPSLKVGRNALPYEMKMPKLPFKIYRYGFNIRDLKHDGKHIRATFIAAPKDENAKMKFSMEASHPVIKNKLLNVTEIELADGIRGEYKGNALYFQLEDVSYNIIYWNGEIPQEQQRQELIDMANDIID